MNTTTLSLDIPTRLNYLRFHQGYEDDLRSVWHFIQPKLMQVLEIFYGHVSAQAHLAKLFEGRSLEKIKQAQYDHWQGLFSYGFNADYEKRVTRIGMAHAKIGLNPRWFFGAYCLIINEVTPILATAPRLRLQWKKASNLNAAFQKAVFMDLDAINAVYEHMTNLKIEEDRIALMKATVDSFNNEVAGHIGSVAAAGEQLSSTADSIRGQAHEVNNLAEEARNLGMEAHGVNTRLTETTQEIAMVVGLIQDVAQQTNLLALNASIEAARAGDQGRGFGVVADEVKKLAQATSNATDDIRNKIGQIQTVVTQSVQASDKVMNSVERISNNANVISQSLGEQEQATSDISRSMTDVQNLIQNFFQRLAVRRD